MMPSNKTHLTKHQSVIFPAIIAGFCLLILLVFYLVTLWVRGDAVYDSIKQVTVSPMQADVVTTGHSGHFDSTLGYVLTPNYTGSFLMPLGEPVTLHHNAAGMRAPLDRRFLSGLKAHPELLFFGDSFTYGSLVAYQSTFPYQTARRLGGTPVNAGVPGYGLAQMVIQARELISKYRPDYVVTQYSPWLVIRSEQAMLPDKGGLVTAPYFYRTNAGEMAVVPPPFVPSSHLMQLMEHYKTTPKGFLDKLTFFARVGVPFYLEREYSLLKLKLGSFLGAVPAVSTDTRAIIQFTYRELGRLAEANGAKLVIVALGTAVPLKVPTELFPKDALVVNAWAAQVAALPEPNSTEYIKQYFIWGGTPPQPVNGHPNKLANAITAGAIAERIDVYRRNERSVGAPQGCVNFQMSKTPWFHIDASVLASLTLPELGAAFCAH